MNGLSATIGICVTEDDRTGATSYRNGSVEIMRLVAAAGIIWFHAHAALHMVSYAALSLFVVFLIVLPLQRPLPASLASYARDRADRLLRPWLIWSCIFTGLKVAQAKIEGRPLASEFDWTMLLTGSQAHLWFLPFGFVCSVVGSAVARKTNRGSRMAFATSVLLAIASGPAISMALDQGLSAPLAEWTYGLGAVFFGMAIHFADRNQRRLQIVTLATFAGLAASASVVGPQDGNGALLVGVNLAILAMTTHTPSRPWTRWAAAVSLPVYLCHPVFLSFLQRAESFRDSPNSVAIVAIGLSLSAGAAILSSPWGRKLL